MGSVVEMLMVVVVLDWCQWVRFAVDAAGGVWASGTISQRF